MGFTSDPNCRHFFQIKQSCETAAQKNPNSIHTAECCFPQPFNHSFARFSGVHLQECIPGASHTRVHLCQGRAGDGHPQCPHPWVLCQSLQPMEIITLTVVTWQANRSWSLPSSVTDKYAFWTKSLPNCLFFKWSWAIIFKPCYEE